MTAAATLVELQHWLLSAITRPAATTTLKTSAVVAASRSQTPTDRLAVYQHAYLARLLDVLREQFPCTRFAVGDDLFDQFALGYLQQHPPTSYTLANLADQFAEYLNATRPQELAATEFLVELTRLEQAIDQVFDGPGPEHLPSFSLPEAVSGDLHIELALGAQLHAFAFPTSAFYSAWKAGQQPAWPQSEPQYIALFRRDYIVRRLALSALQHAILKRLNAGEPLAEALAGAAVAAPTAEDFGADQLARDIRSWFTLWAAAGLIAAAH